MSDLQLGLVVIGVAIVAAVFAFNHWQERQLKRRVRGESAADPNANDDSVGHSDGQARMEPRLSRAGAAGDDTQEPIVSAQVSSRPSVVLEAERPAAAPLGDSAVDYLCHLTSSSPIPGDALNELSHSVRALGSRSGVRALATNGSVWLELPVAVPQAMSEAMVSMQLVDRSGAVNRVQLSALRDLVQGFAHTFQCACECPPIDEAARTAIELDRYCADIDISIGCNVVAKTGAAWVGTKLRGLLESAGFSLASDGRFWLRADDGTTLVSASDLSEQPFTLERLRTHGVAGISFAVDVPRVPANAKAVERMLDAARQLAHAFDVEVVDDKRAPLTDAGIKIIREQVRSVQAAMQARNMPAGSPLALRLFS